MKSGLINRWRNKYKKINNNHFFKKSFKIICYIGNDIINIVITHIFKYSFLIPETTDSKILFIEPLKQGYGDLLFQTPIFQALGSLGKLDVLVKGEHSVILYNNPHIQDVFTNRYSVDFKKYDVVVFLTRSTVLENYLAYKCSNAKKIALDLNLAIWVESFTKYSHTVAWQKVCNQFLTNHYQYNKPTLYADSSSMSKIGYIVIIAGVEREEKAIPNICELISKITQAFPDSVLYLLGKSYNDHDFPSSDKIVNLVSKTTYGKSIDIIKNSDIVIGPEGSLVHISTTMGKLTIIGEFGRNFHKYSDIFNGNLYLQDDFEVSLTIDNIKKAFSRKFT